MQNARFPLAVAALLLNGACNAPPPPSAPSQDAVAVVEVPDTAEADRARAAAEADVALASLHAAVAKNDAAAVPPAVPPTDPSVAAALAELGQAVAKLEALTPQDGGVDPTIPASVTPEERAKAEATVARLNREMAADEAAQAAKMIKAPAWLACRERVSHARTALKVLYVAQESLQAETGSYGPTLASLKMPERKPESNANYDVVLVQATAHTFVAEARGKGAMAGDLWRISEKNDLANVTDLCGKL